MSPAVRRTVPVLTFSSIHKHAHTHRKRPSNSVIRLHKSRKTRVADVRSNIGVNVSPVVQKEPHADVINMRDKHITAVMFMEIQQLETLFSHQALIKFNLRKMSTIHTGTKSIYCRNSIYVSIGEMINNFKITQYIKANLPKFMKISF